MTIPPQFQSEPARWRAFTDALVTAARASRPDDQADHIRHGLAAVCPPGELEVSFGGQPIPRADVSIVIGVDPERRCHVHWSGRHDHRDQAETILREATERIRPLIAAWETLHIESRQDALTGVKNRRALDEDLPPQLSLSLRHGTSLSLLMMDIDGFKLINDTHGHAAGDRALVVVAEWLGQAVRTEDQLFRYGGDEFLLVLPHTDAAGFTQLSARIQEGSPMPISTGGATAMANDTVTSLLLRADKALLAAKGR